MHRPSRSRSRYSNPVRMPIAFYTLLIELVCKGEIYLAAKPRVIPVASVGAINHRSEECGDPEARKDRVVEINFASNDQIARRPVEPSQQILASSNERRVLAVDSTHGIRCWNERGTLRVCLSPECVRW